MKKPYVLKKRSPQNIWYYKLDEEGTFHSTGCKVKAQAESHVLNIIYGEKQNMKEFTIGKFTENMFITGKCQYMKRMEKRGKNITNDMAKMRRGQIVNHILPQFNKRYMNNITALEIDNWLSDLPVANKTKNHILATLRIIFDEALLHDLVEKNPARVLKNFPNNSRTRDIFDYDEINKLFPASATATEIETIWYSEMWFSFFSMLIKTGARLSEIRALRWEDWNRDFKVVTIARSVKNDGSIGTTKNGLVRHVPLIDDCNDILEQWYKSAEYNEKSDLVFSKIKNKPLCRKSCKERFDKALEKAGIELGNRNIVIHSLRHTANTYYRKNLSDEDLRLITGHLDPKMTEHYDHPTVADDINKVTPFRQRMEKSWNRESQQKNDVI